MEQAVAFTRRKDRFFDFNMIDRSKSNFRKSKKIDFLRADLIDYRKINKKSTSLLVFLRAGLAMSSVN